MTHDLAGTYCSCMEDVKRRLAVVNTMAKRSLTIGSEDFDYEFVALQLRKSLELIAFASMTANKKLYAKAHANFANHWKAKTMLSSLDRIHLGFYPQPIFLDHVKESGAKHFDHVKDGYLTKDDFVTLYDLCSEVLHTWNPFTSKKRYIDFKRSVSEWSQRITRLLKLHLMRFVDRDEVWVVEMESDPDKKVRAFISAPIA